MNLLTDRKQSFRTHRQSLSVFTGHETNSALLLGDGTFLSLAQIKSLPNIFCGVELLTLSACNTATGGSGANGKEVEGLSVLAQRQGAKAVVASLWPVADLNHPQSAFRGPSKIVPLLRGPDVSMGFIFLGGGRAEGVGLKSFGSSINLDLVRPD